MGKSILFKATFNLEKHEGKWNLFPGMGVSKVDTALAATDGQKVQIICPLTKGTEPWQVIPALLSIKTENCAMRVQVDLN